MITEVKVYTTTHSATVIEYKGESITFACPVQEKSPKDMMEHVIEQCKEIPDSQTLLMVMCVPDLFFNTTPNGEGQAVKEILPREGEDATGILHYMSRYSCKAIINKKQ